MPASEQLTYIPAAESAATLRIIIRASAPPVADWVGAAATQALSLTPAPGSSTGPSEQTDTLTIELERGASVPPTSSEGLASDERGELMRTDTGWRWACSGYDLFVSGDAKRATIALHESSGSSRGPQVTAYALRHTLTMLLPRVRRYPLHAAGLRAPGSHRTLLLAGPSGCGKSTLSAGLLDRDWQCLSDDMLVLMPSTDPPPQSHIYGLTPHVRLWPDAWERLDLSDRNTRKRAEPYGASEKRSFAPRSQNEGRSAAMGEPHWILFPELDDRPQSRLAPMDASEALRRGFEQTPPPAALPDAVATAQFDAVATLIRQSRCFRLHAGRDLYDDPGRLAALLADQARASAPPETEDAFSQ